MPQKRKKYDLVEGIERVIDVIDQQSDFLQGFAKALTKKKEDREKDQPRQMKNDIAKIKRATLEGQRKVDSQQETLFSKSFILRFRPDYEYKNCWVLISWMEGPPRM